jgi:hypothetical protein
MASGHGARLERRPSLDRRHVLRVLAGSALLPLGAAPMVHAVQAAPAGAEEAGTPGCGGTFDAKLQQFYVDFAAGDWPAVMALLSPGIVLKVPDAFAFGATIKGPNRVISYLKRVARVWAVSLDGVTGFESHSLAVHHGVTTDQGGCNSSVLARFNADGLIEEAALIGFNH